MGPPEMNSQAFSPVKSSGRFVPRTSKPADGPSLSAQPPQDVRGRDDVETLPGRSGLMWRHGALHFQPERPDPERLGALLDERPGAAQ